jgi:hypothetical protein
MHQYFVIYFFIIPFSRLHLIFFVKVAMWIF